MFRVEVIGNLGASAEFRAVDGREFYTFKVAHTERYKRSDGQEVERTQWVSCIMGKAYGEKVAAFLLKGKKVYLRGRAQLNVYSSAIDRCMKAGISVDVDELELLGGEPDEMPREVTEPVTGTLYHVYKAAYVSAQDFMAEGEHKPSFPEFLFDKRGRQFRVDNAGFLTSVVPSSQQETASR